MELNEYQKKAMTTCMPTCKNFTYMILNLVSEVGEFAEKVAKQVRKGNMGIDDDMLMVDEGNVPDNKIVTLDDALKKEAGDILWQLSGLCEIMGWNLDDVAQTNLDKLAARKAANTIDGSGDGIQRPK